jgi:methyl-accepting chemotaxis protein
LKEINTAVNTMDQNTQQNAAMVEESTAASHALATEADSLRALLDQFKMGTAAAPATRRAAPVKPAPIHSGPAPARPDATPTASPAHAMANKVAQAFNAGGSASAAATDNWEEF